MTEATYHPLKQILDRRIAILDGAILSGARFVEADFLGASLSGAHYSAEDLEGALHVPTRVEER